MTKNLDYNVPYEIFTQIFEKVNTHSSSLNLAINNLTNSLDNLITTINTPPTNREILELIKTQNILKHQKLAELLSEMKFRTELDRHYYEKRISEIMEYVKKHTKDLEEIIEALEKIDIVKEKLTNTFKEESSREPIKELRDMIRNWLWVLSAIWGFFLMLALYARFYLF